MRELRPPARIATATWGFDFKDGLRDPAINSRRYRRLDWLPEGIFDRELQISMGVIIAFAKSGHVFPKGR
jgi:hypothetical protein